MKKSLLYILPLALLTTSCVQNETTGQYEPTWLFWVFLGVIVLGMVAGVIGSSIRSKRSSDEFPKPNHTEEQIEKYEETLEKKEEEDK